VLIDFIYENDLGRAWRKVCLEKGGGFALGRWHPFEKKLNVHGVKRKKGTNSHLSDDIRLRKN